MELRKSANPEFDHLLFLSKKELAYLVALTTRVVGPFDTGLRRFTDILYGRGVDELKLYNTDLVREMADRLIQGRTTLTSTGLEPERLNIKEMTMEELEEALGHPVKIIKE